MTNPDALVVASSLRGWADGTTGSYEGQELKARLIQAADLLEALQARESAAKEQAERLADALVELKGQVEQARDGFDRWPYNNSPSMKHSLTGAAKALAAWEKSRG